MAKPGRVTKKPQTPEACKLDEPRHLRRLPGQICFANLTKDLGSRGDDQIVFKLSKDPNLVFCGRDDSKCGTVSVDCTVKIPVTSFDENKDLPPKGIPGWHGWNGPTERPESATSKLLNGDIEVTELGVI